MACLIEPKTFSKVETKQKINQTKNLISRPEAIGIILDSIKKTKIVSTVGYTSRELHQINKTKKNKFAKEFLMVGGMGHTATTSLGISCNDKEDVICLDGDGSFLMHMGGVATAVIYSKILNIFFLIIIHMRSTGNQLTISNKLDFKKIALDLDLKSISVWKIPNYKEKLKKYVKMRGKVFIYIKTRIGSLKTLSRPSSLQYVKKQFMK